jgi:signal transduction histidine kinase
LSNACKFSQSGGNVRLSITHEGQALVLSVTDDGIGIAAKDVPRLFQRFVQVESAANRRYEGTGIGLAIVKELTELHGGKVEVDSQPGVGSCFRVLLPSRQAAEPQAALDPSASESGAAEVLPLGWSARTQRAPTPVPLEGESAPGTPLEKRRCLFVVEDNADLLLYLKQELSRDYRVLAFSDSLQAIHKATEDPPDLILSDVMMPVLDGLELVKRVRSEPRTRDIPVLLLSAHDELETKVAGLSAGADDYIPKPFQLPEVRARIELHLRLRAQAFALERKAQELSSALCDLTQAQASLVHSEKLAAIGRVVAGVAHEINNPLHFLKGNLAILRRRAQKAMPEGTFHGLSPLLVDIDASTERILGITKDLLLFGRRDAQAPTTISALDVVTLALKMVTAQVGPGVRITHRMNATHTVTASPQDLFQIILNLLQNAIQAVNPENGEVRVEGESTDQGMLELRIIDNGCGMDPDTAGKIFDPFFTTKAPGQGTGLGLAIVQNLVLAQKGTLHVTSALGQGSTFALRLPSGGSA